MAGFRVGLAHAAINGRPFPEALMRAEYLCAVATRVDSLWVPDHLNALLPRSIYTPEYFGVSKLIPCIDASFEPWTVLGHLAARNRLGRLRLGISVTDASRRNPAVTAQAAATLHLLPGAERYSASASVSGRATNRTASTGPNQLRGLRKPSRRFARCGIHAVF